MSEITKHEPVRQNRLVSQTTKWPGKAKRKKPKCHGASPSNAARERSRVKALSSAFLHLQKSLPAVPPDTKLSKLDVLILATTYIAHLTKTLQKLQGTTFCYHTSTFTSDKTNRNLISQPATCPCTCDCLQPSDASSRAKAAYRFSTILSEASDSIGQTIFGRPEMVDNINFGTASRVSHCLTHSEKMKCVQARQDTMMSTTSSVMEHSPFLNPSYKLHRDFSKDEILPYRFYSSKTIYPAHDDQKQRQAETIISDCGCNIDHDTSPSIMHPVKKWPMRSRLYQSILGKMTSEIGHVTDT